MLKYRRLNEEELQQFEQDFIRFLVVNGITADDWTVLLKDQSEKAAALIDLFSNTIFDKVLKEVQFLEFRSSKYLQGIQCLEEKMIMVALSSDDQNADLLKLDMNALEAKQFKLHRGEKGYTEDRELELFKLIEKGHEISDGTLFKSLILASVSD